MSTLPGGLLPDYRWQAFDSNGDPLAGALLYAYTSGGSFSTPQALYTDSALSVAHANPTVADADGRFAAMYLLPTSYDLRLKTSAGVTVWSVQNVSDIGQSFLTNLGTTMATGSTGVTSPYTMLTTDNYIQTTGATNPFILTLQTAATRGFPIVIQHQGSGTLRLTPFGAETINGVAAFFPVSAVSSPNFPTVMLLPIPAGTGYIVLGP